MRTYVMTDMHEQLMDFALSMDDTFTLTLFDGGVIVRNVSPSDYALVVMVSPEAEANAWSPLWDNGDLALIEVTLGANQGQALLAEDLVDGWEGVDSLDPGELEALYPDLEFVDFRRESLAA